MDSNRGKKVVKKMEQRCHLKILARVQDFAIFYGKEQVKKKKNPPIDEYFSTVITSQRAQGFRLSLLGNL